MIIPYGHERTSVRRLPWVTFGIMAACIVCFAVAIPTTARGVRTIEQRVTETVEFFSQHPYLELGGELRSWLFRGTDDAEVETILEYARRDAKAPRDPRDLEREQERMDELGHTMIGAIHALPHFRFGVIPKRALPHGFFTYQFMHGGWAHLLGNLFILFVVGPFIEDVWGRPLFAGFYLAAGVFAAVFFVLRYPSVDVPLIGASGAVAGVMAAFGIRFWRTRVRFLIWLIVPLGRFAAPALFVFPLWFAWEFLMASSIDAAAPHSGGGGVAHWAHVAGFAFGLAVAVGMRHFRIEERFIDRAIEDKITLVDNTVVETALATREQGRHEEALRMLRSTVEAEPDNVDAALAWWNLAVDHGQAGEAAPAIQQVIRRALRDGENDLAVSYWNELAEWAPAAALEPAIVVRVAELLVARNDPAAAAAAVERLAVQDRDALPAGVLVRLAKVAVAASSGAAEQIRRTALASPDLPPDARLELEALVCEPQIGAGHPEVAAAQEPEVERLDLVTSTRPHTLRVLEATPSRLGLDSVTLSLEGGTRVLPFDQIQAVAVAGITRPEGRPYLLVDLLLDPPWGVVEQLRVVRMPGSAFDPRKVVGGDDAMTAFRELLAALLDGSEAVPLPDPGAARGNPFRLFPSLAAYEREVLGSSGGS